jgi:hypothetical protein
MTASGPVENNVYATFKALIVIALAVVTSVVSAAQNDELTRILETPATLLNASELSEVVAPIALYPDDLVALALPAATYPLQVVQAARFQRGENTDVSYQEWDDSIVALLNYPEVITLLNKDLDWLWLLGSAFLAQPADLFNAVQNFRQEAFAAGHLVSDDKQIVSVEDHVITIRSRYADRVYVPYYEPEQVVTYQPRSAYHYHDQTYPSYYYPYSPAQVHSHTYFYSVRNYYRIGWGSSYLYNYHPDHHRHPYYKHRLAQNYGYSNSYHYKNRYGHHNRTLAKPFLTNPRPEPHRQARRNYAPDLPVWQPGRDPMHGTFRSGMNPGSMRQAIGSRKQQAVRPGPNQARGERDPGRTERPSTSPRNPDSQPQSPADRVPGARSNARRGTVVARTGSTRSLKNTQTAVERIRSRRTGGDQTLRRHAGAIEPLQSAASTQARSATAASRVNPSQRPAASRSQSSPRSRTMAIPSGRSQARNNPNVSSRASSSARPSTTSSARSRATSSLRPRTTSSRPRASAGSKMVLPGAHR